MDIRGADCGAASAVLLEPYVGGLCDRRFHGVGRTVSVTGDEYCGQFEHGRRNGTGVMVWAGANLRYIGQWSQNHASGLGTLSFANGGTYYGDVARGTRHGLGLLVLPGATYVGEWQNGLRHGFGVQSNEDGIYTGEWQHGRRSGWGSMQFASGNIYYGDFRDDVMHGYGSMTWQRSVSVEVVVGGGVGSGGLLTSVTSQATTSAMNSISNNNASGMSTPGGTPAGASDIVERYEGEFAQGQPHGHGDFYLAFTSATGFETLNHFRGEVAQGQRNGPGMQVFADGTAYEGTWIANNKHGPGTIYHPDGSFDAVLMENDAATTALNPMRGGLTGASVLKVHDLVLQGEREIADVAEIAARYNSHLRLLFSVYAAAEIGEDPAEGLRRLAQNSGSKVPMPGFATRAGLNLAKVPAGITPLDRNIRLLGSMARYLENTAAKKTRQVCASARQILNDVNDFFMAHQDLLTGDAVSSPPPDEDESPTDPDVDKPAFQLGAAAEPPAIYSNPSGVAPLHQPSLLARHASKGALQNMLNSPLTKVSNTSLVDNNSMTDPTSARGGRTPSSSASPSYKSPLRGVLESGLSRAVPDASLPPIGVPLLPKTRKPSITPHAMYHLLVDSHIVSAHFSRESFDAAIYPVLQRASSPGHLTMAERTLTFNGFVEALVRVAHTRFALTFPFASSNANQQANLALRFQHLIEEYLLSVVATLRELDLCNDFVAVLGSRRAPKEPPSNCTLDELRKAAAKALKEKRASKKDGADGGAPAASGATAAGGAPPPPIDDGLHVSMPSATMSVQSSAAIGNRPSSASTDLLTFVDSSMENGGGGATSAAVRSTAVALDDESGASLKVWAVEVYNAAAAASSSPTTPPPASLCQRRHSVIVEAPSDGSAVTAAMCKLLGIVPAEEAERRRAAVESLAVCPVLLACPLKAIVAFSPIAHQVSHYLDTIAALYKYTRGGNTRELLRFAHQHGLLIDPGVVPQRKPPPQRPPPRATLPVSSKPPAAVAAPPPPAGGATLPPKSSAAGHQQHAPPRAGGSHAAAAPVATAAPQPSAAAKHPTVAATTTAAAAAGSGAPVSRYQDATQHPTPWWGRVLRCLVREIFSTDYASNDASAKASSRPTSASSTSGRPMTPADPRLAKLLQVKAPDFAHALDLLATQEEQLGKRRDVLKHLDIAYGTTSWESVAASLNLAECEFVEALVLVALINRQQDRGDNTANSTPSVGRAAASVRTTVASVKRTTAQALQEMFEAIAAALRNVAPFPPEACVGFGGVLSLRPPATDGSSASSKSAAPAKTKPLTVDATPTRVVDLLTHVEVPPVRWDKALGKLKRRAPVEDPKKKKKK